MNTINFKNKNYTPSKIICVGKNYDDHITEMGGGGRPSIPTIFIKPNSSLAYNPKEIFIPESLGLLHHEVELCFFVGNRAKDVSSDEARKCIAGYAVGIDLTLRDLQSEAKKKGLPWTLAKGFDRSAVIGEFVLADKVGNPLTLDISLSVNGAVKQRSNTRNMIFTSWEILSFTSRYMTIEEGDIFMCGTPSGVGPVTNSARIEAEISNAPRLVFRVRRG